MRNLIAIVAALLIPGLPCNMRVASQDVPRSTTFRFTRDPRGALLVLSRIDDNCDARLVLDTGSAQIALSEDFVKRNRIAMRPPIGSDGRPLTLGFPAIKVVGIAALTGIRIDTDTLFQGPEVLVLEDRAIRRMSDGPVDGILGMKTFMYTSILLDFQQRSVTVYYPNTLTTEELRLAGMEGATGIPIEIQNRQAYATLTFLADQEEKLCIDTGAVRTGISSGLAARLGLRPKLHREGVSLGGNQKVAASTVPTVQLGDITLKDMPVEYTDNGKAELPPHLGQDVLSRFRILIDIPGKRMYLKPNGSGAQDKAG